MKTIAGVLLITLSLLVQAVQYRVDDIETWKIAENDPIGAVGHGAVFSAEGKEINPSPDFVIDAQRFYLKRLYQRANQRQQAEFKAKPQGLQDIRIQTQAERILVNAAMLSWLIETVKPQDAPYLASKNAALLAQFARITASETTMNDTRAGPVRQELVDRLRREGLLIFLK